MPRLKIDTEKSLYKPVEVEIDGKVFRVKRLTRAILQEAEILDGELGAGKLDSAWKRLDLLLGKSKVFDKLDLNQVAEITRFIVRSMFTLEKDEKNGLGPGDGKSPL